MEEVNFSAKQNSAHHNYYEVENTEQTQQQLQKGQRNQQQHQLSTSSPNVQNQQHYNTTMGIIYGFRTRHLSCIEENDSDSLHSSSMAISPLQIMKDVDETFTKLVNNERNGEGNQQIKYDIEVDCIRMIDEMRIYDTNYMEKICEEENIKKQETDENQYLITDEMVHTLCNSDYNDLNNEQCQRPMADIMTTSCYGTLNDTSYSDISDTSTPIKHSTSKQRGAIYATPEKRRDVNRSIDSSFASLSSSTLGSGLGFNAGSLTSSLDLKCMGTSAQSFILHRSVDNKSDAGLMDAAKLDFSTYGCGDNGSSGEGEFFSPAGEVCPEIAEKCPNATEKDFLSIRSLLEHETSGSICPNCGISFDKGKRRKLIDTCGHERCYSCMFRNDQCPMCMNISLKDVDGNNAQGYDTGIGGSTSTIVSPLGSPQPQLRSQNQRANGAASAKYMQSISPENYRYGSTSKLSKGVVATYGENNQSNNSAPVISSSTTMEVPSTVQYTVTADIHNNNTKTTKSSAGNDLSHCNGKNNVANNNCNVNSNKNNNHTFSEIHATLYATPPTRRRFYNHKNLRNALAGSVVGHRRAASNGGCYIDTASILSEGSNQLTVEQSSNYASEKQRDQLRTRLGLLWHHDQNGNNSNTTASSRSSHNISPEQTLTAASSGLSTNSFDGSHLSMSTKEGTFSLCDKLKGCSILDSSEYTEILPMKARKSIIRRSARTTQFSYDNNKRSAIYKTQARILQPQCTVQLPLKPLFFEVPLQEPDPPFIGRQWLIRELSNVLTATETPGVLINGNPGTGKTAFILQLVEYSCFGRRKNFICDSETDGIYYQITTANDRMRALSAHVVAYHFCQADANLTCLVPDFVHSLAAQLCQAPQLSAYRHYLLNEPHVQNILNIKECIADAERVMRMAILEPLTVLKRTGKILSKTCIILVDALCEAEYHRPDHGHTIVTFLAKMTQYFPSWLKVVATVRTQMMEFVKGLSYTKMTLDSWSSNDLLQKDMLDYITFRINNNPDIQKNVAVVKDHNTGQLKFIGHLQALTKGSVLYAKLILDLIERGQLVIKSTSYKVLPVSVAQIFLLHFNLRFPTINSFAKAAPILNVCLAALYPLTLTEIYYTICAMKTDKVVPWDEFLERFKLLDGFLIKRIDNTYMFFHSSFREWLIRRDEGESAKFLCDFRVGHAAIAFRLSRLQALLQPEQTLELGHHMLKAHIYRNSQGPQSPRDMQAFWVCSVADNVSAALGSLRNVYSPNLKVSRLILLAGASPHYRTGFMGDATILCLASHEGIVPMVSLLLEFGADVGLTNSQGCTPLILAALRGHCDVVRLLVAAGSSLGQTDITQRCALVHAARMGRFNVVKYLLACDWTPRPNTNDVNLNLAIQQALISAASQDHITIVEDLLDMENIDINQIEPTSGDLALTAASRNGCLSTIEILLSRGAKIDLHNKQYFTALGVSVKKGHWAVVEKLLQNGADIDTFVTANQKTSLMIAAEEGHIEIMEMLIDKGANLETQDSEGFTALLWACLRGRQTAAKILIEKGCNKNHSDNNGRSPIDLAAYQGSASLVLYLMEQGANIEHLDINGMRPLDRAIACRNTQVVQVLLRRGAKIRPTTWSVAMGKQEILVVLLNKLLEDGNILYWKNHFQEAAQRYQYALRKISNLDSLVERSTIFAQLRINLLLNLSRCKRKLNDLDESIDLATQAIAQKPSTYEGYYARAKALMQNADFNAALADANEAMQKAAKSSVLPEVVEVLKRIQTDLLARLTQEGRQRCGEANNLKSPHEITDL